MITLHPDFLLNEELKLHPTKVLHLARLIQAVRGPLICDVRSYEDLRKICAIKMRGTKYVMEDLERDGFITRVFAGRRLREIHINIDRFKSKK